ncbi:protein Barley B recombinant-like [Iris pallida]|uniref:GAGA-binding transcriptional activator n=1 Tax=Iris pallida TaxID=29817 RepID=A0AAX6F7M4_IRIPA|nr:protein Barley B recombinant-like [Iris pallida]
MSNVTSERDTKPLISHGSFFHRDNSVLNPPAPMEYHHPGYNNVLNHRENKFMHVYDCPGYGALPDASGTQTTQMLQPHEPPKEEEEPMVHQENGHNDAPLKRRSQGRMVKSPKPKKQKKVNNQARDELNNGTESKGKSGKRSTGLVINGIDLDLSGIPTPVCSLREIHNNVTDGASEGGNQRVVPSVFVSTPPNEL